MANPTPAQITVAANLRREYPEIASLSVDIDPETGDVFVDYGVMFVDGLREGFIDYIGIENAIAAAVNGSAMKPAGKNGDPFPGGVLNVDEVLSKTSYMIPGAATLF